MAEVTECVSRPGHQARPRMDPRVVLNAGLGQTAHLLPIAGWRRRRRWRAANERALRTPIRSNTEMRRPYRAAAAGRCARRKVRTWRSAQGIRSLGSFQGVEAHFRPRRKQCRFHGGGIRMSWDVVRQDQNGRLAGAQEIARHGEDKWEIVEFNPPPGMSNKGKPEPISS
jgi:hypothetical protein